MSDSQEYEGTGAKLKKFKMDLEDISIVMDTNRWENEVYLDTNTGELIYVPVELNEDNVYDEEYIARLPEWQKEMVETVQEIYEDEEERFRFIPERGTTEAYETMVRFTKGIDDIDIAERLFDALDGKGAFSRFRKVLSRYPKIDEEWYKFKTEAEKQEVREWLRSVGIEPVEKE